MLRETFSLLDASTIFNIRSHLIISTIFLINSSQVSCFLSLINFQDSKLSLLYNIIQTDPISFGILSVIHNNSFCTFLSVFDWLIIQLLNRLRLLPKPSHYNLQYKLSLYYWVLRLSSVMRIITSNICHFFISFALWLLSDSHCSHIWYYWFQDNCVCKVKHSY